MLDIRRLIVLRAIAAEGSIAAAGRALSYTRSAVSQQLTALENETGAQLVERAGNRITLTSVGRALVEHTERILVELRAAEAMLASDSQAVGGLLRVGVPFGEGPRTMSRALTAVRERFPGLEIRLIATSDEAAAEQVRRGLLDMAIISRYGAAHPRQIPGLREWVLGSDPLMLCVPVGHKLGGTTEATITELRDESWIICPDSMLGRLTMTLCVTAGFEPELAATANDLATAVGLVGAGWGITVAPELTPVNAALPVEHVRLVGVATQRHSVLIVRDGEQLSPRIAATIAEVRSVSALSWSKNESPQ
jgi:DNA-binding transcriptional LysR family regulator